MVAFGGSQWCFIILIILVFQLFSLNSEQFPVSFNLENDKSYVADLMEELETNTTEAEAAVAAAANKRACIPRGGNCDNRRKECCYNSACRCNLWGFNCRCQRMGLFQKWG